MMTQSRTITFEDICALNIPPETCVQWASEIIRRKKECVLPTKNSIKYGSDCFFNTMPSFLPFMNRFGVKVVSRIPGRNPAIKADILLYDSETGGLLSFMDGTWITTMRTGAVAAITIMALKKRGAAVFSFIGLGNTARATLLCYDAMNGHEDIEVGLLKYKGQHLDFMERFADHKNIHFRLFGSVEDLIAISDVVVSCVTAANSVFADERLFKKGVLVVPVHTRGFQNCDLAFDRIFCDDLAHISDFKYFAKYKSVAELTDVVVPPPPVSCADNPQYQDGTHKKIMPTIARTKEHSASISSTQYIKRGRGTDEERILAYNIGISIQDIYFASRILDSADWESVPKKFWV